MILHHVPTERLAQLEKHLAGPFKREEPSPPSASTGSPYTRLPTNAPASSVPL